jgi:hypothetical protein
LSDKDFESFVDEYGFIGHKDRKGNLTDFGDSTQRTFSWVTFNALNDKYRYDTELEKATHQYYTNIRIVFPKFELVRHWDDTHWPGQRGTMSRDNITPIIIALGLLGSHFLPELIFELFKRGGFLWNSRDIAGDKKPWYIPNDWIGLRNISNICRGLIRKNAYWYVPLIFVLYVTDISILIQSVIQVIKSWFERPGSWNTTDDLNLSLETLMARSESPTLWSWVARLVYSLRGVAGDDFKRFNMPWGPYSAWASYYRHKSAPPMHRVGEECLKQL